MVREYDQGNFSKEMKACTKNSISVNTVSKCAKQQWESCFAFLIASSEKLQILPDSALVWLVTLSPAASVVLHFLEFELWTKDELLVVRISIPPAENASESSPCIKAKSKDITSSVFNNALVYFCGSNTCHKTFSIFSEPCRTSDNGPGLVLLHTVCMHAHMHVCVCKFIKKMSCLNNSRNQLSIDFWRHMPFHKSVQSPVPTKCLWFSFDRVIQFKLHIWTSQTPVFPQNGIL